MMGWLLSVGSKNTIPLKEKKGISPISENANDQ
jgi:hypothetical protein